MEVEMLQRLLYHIDDVDIIGSHVHPYKALEEIRILSPHVVFLDIQLQEITGIELAKQIHQMDPFIHIIFVTEYSTHAISAFEEGAIDYILKPVSEARLLKSIERVKRIQMASTSSLMKTKYDAKLCVKMLGNFEVYGIDGVKLKWRTAKEKELFAFLVLRGTAGVSPDILLEVLWPEENPSKAKVYLHTCVSYIRKKLRPYQCSNALTYSNKKYYLDRTEMKIDYWEWMEYAMVPRLGEMLFPPIQEKMSMALHGTLLQDCDYIWAEQDREQMNRLMMEFYIRSALNALENGEKDGAMHLLQSVIFKDRYNEEAYRLLMKIYVEEGRHDAVMRVYIQLEQALNELSIKPSYATKNILEQTLIT